MYWHTHILARTWSRAWNSRSFFTFLSFLLTSSLSLSLIISSPSQPDSNNFYSLWSSQWFYFCSLESNPYSVPSRCFCCYCCFVCNSFNCCCNVPNNDTNTSIETLEGLRIQYTLISSHPLIHSVTWIRWSFLLFYYCCRCLSFFLPFSFSPIFCVVRNNIFHVCTTKESSAL